ncbi:aminoglycoside phosphotransferase [Streptosporangium saharense]|uniref:aminoglycoside phosphotransferase n=1 Tax=Streptosporangium saharense TaxID=1706840 RepID=UPI00342BFD15
MRPSTLATVDLRSGSVDEVLGRVERALGVRLDRESLVRKRRTLGAVSDRGTWVRVERRIAARIGGQGWNGAECAAVLRGVAKPVWHGGVSWSDSSGEVMWRADETELLPAPPVKAGGVLTVDPGLPDEWWLGLNSSLDALSGQETTRVATPDTVMISRRHVAETVGAVFGGDVDASIETWTTAHADFHWANVTGPRFCVFDWEDWGMAPQGLDAASLWSNSLAVPDLAERVRRECARDLSSRDGKVMMLFCLAKIAGPHAHPADPRLGLAREEAARLVAELRRPSDHEDDERGATVSSRSGGGVVSMT